MVARLQSNLFENFLGACVKFMDRYVMLAIRDEVDGGWNMEEVQEIGNSTSAVAFDRIYKHTTDAIMDEEPEKWSEMSEKAELLAQKKGEYKSDLEAIAIPAQRIIEMYIAAKPLKKNLQILLKQCRDQINEHKRSSKRSRTSWWRRSTSTFVKNVSKTVKAFSFF